MFDIICVTNRALVGGDFLKRLEAIAAASPDAIILREKDLPQDEYRQLALSALDICRFYNVKCILHTYVDVAKELKAPVHLPMHVLRALSESQKQGLIFGASCHSVQEVLEAQKSGCSYVTVGHIFRTDCKKGLEGRGVEFLRLAATAVDIPVYAIGGIDRANIKQIVSAGARGACVMSGAMTAPDIKKYISDLKQFNCLLI